MTREHQDAVNAFLKPIESSGAAASEKEMSQGEVPADEELPGLLEGIENMSDEEVRELERKLGTIFK